MEEFGKREELDCADKREHHETTRGTDLKVRERYMNEEEDWGAHVTPCSTQRETRRILIMNPRQMPDRQMLKPGGLKFESSSTHLVGLEKDLNWRFNLDGREVQVLEPQRQKLSSLLNVSRILASRQRQWTDFVRIVWSRM